MFSSSLSLLLSGLQELRNYIQHNSLIDDVITEAVPNAAFNNGKVQTLIEHAGTFRRKKIFEYNSYIISLYGLFERYLENVLEDYLLEYSRIYKNYNTLPKSIRDRNLSVTIELLKLLDLPKYKALKPEDIINRINSSLVLDQPILIVEGFSHHSNNFRHSAITEYFKQAGIDNLSKLLTYYEPLKANLDDKYGNTANLDATIIFEVINDLAQRRNDVAHGVDDIQLIGKTIVYEYILFVENYCTSLFRILENEISKTKFFSATPLEMITVIKGEILCVTPCKKDIKIGDSILVQKTNQYYPQFEELEIESLQINNASLSTIYSTNTENFAMRLKGRINKNFLFRI